MAQSKRLRIYSEASGRIPIRMTNDYMFKAVLQKNRRVLKALICAVLHLNPRRLHKVQILNPIVLGEAVDEKEIILDVRLLFDDQMILDLEMQVEDRHNWRERSLYYVCRNYTQMEGGSDYREAIPSIQIGFLDYTLFPNHPSFCSVYRMMEQDKHYGYSDKVRIHVVDLKQIDRATEEDKRYEIDKWARLFKAETWEEIKMIAAKDRTLAEAAMAIYELSEDDAIRELCWAREDYVHSHAIEEREKRKLEREIRKMKKELKQSKNDLEQTQSDLEQTQNNLEQTKITVDKLQEDKKKLQDDKKKLQEDRRRDKEKIARLKAQLAAAQK
ncbi:MAG: Rpn family recombination-promoting nuclease/putative transposase [Lachnospiraceae bacterium]|nr:Rpn family recombination-promoting nuclease/putative transposase [Lachnospiraceae bacterium]